MKNMQASIQAEMAVMPSTLGEALLMELKMLIKTRKSVTSKAIRPKRQIVDWLRILKVVRI